MATIAREKFLSQASVSLQDSTPSLAQQLRLSLLSLEKITGSANRSDSGRYCPVCGGLNVDLRTVEVRKPNSNTQGTSVPATKPDRPSLDIYKCRTCSRSKKVPVQESKAEPVQKSRLPSSVSVSEMKASKDRDSKVQKTSSKKRAKDRKDREGLQALLSKKTDSTRPASSFDLMDFMSSRS